MEWLPHIITAVLSVVASYVTLRIRFERFQSMDSQREKDWTEWRARLEERVQRMDNREQAHETFCDGRWNKLMQDHGGLLARVEMLQNGRGRTR